MFCSVNHVDCAGEEKAGEKRGSVRKVAFAEYAEIIDSSQLPPYVVADAKQLSFVSVGLRAREF